MAEEGGVGSEVLRRGRRDVLVEVGLGLERVAGSTTEACYPLQAEKRG